MSAHVNIVVDNISKDYNYKTIFQGLSTYFSGSETIALLGDNGSGKSTFLKIISGMTGATTGSVKWFVNEKEVPEYKWYEWLSFCSPQFFFDVRFSVLEILQMYMEIKPFPEHMSADDLIERMGFEQHADKKMNELSSGMYQRVRLILSICTRVPVLFLDEPCSNLDTAGVNWYNQLIGEFANEKLVFVASNDPREYEFCTRSVQLMDYK